MAYSVTVYKNSGFNAGNIPDSPALLEQCTKLNSLPTIEILQDSGLTEIYIKSTLSQIEGADYVKVGSWYYIVNGMPKMMSPDVVRLSLTPDFVTSAGGAGSLSYTDGVTERVCVPVSSDTFGKYTEADPLTTPAEVLDLQTDTISYAGGNERVFIEATVNVNTGGDTTNPPTEALTYEDPASGETCTVPFMPTITTETVHKYGGKRGTATFTPTATSNVLNGVKRARGLGVESSIISQYTVPEVFIQTAEATMYTQLDGREDTVSLTGLPYEQATVKNKRALYGEYTRYGMLSMGGNKIEFRAEDIYESGATRPSVKMKADIRGEGCPYWRYSTYLGDSSDAGFWRNCLAGAPWQNVPLVYSEKSGSILDRQQYDASRQVAEAQRKREIVGGTLSAVGNIARGASRAYETGGAVGAIGAGVGEAINSGVDMYNAYKDYHEQGMLSALEFGQSQVVAPELNFPFNTNIMRDALKNSCICYRYYYTSSDLARIDKLLTMYGYRYTKALEASDFTNRPKFNYVKTQGGITSTSNGNGRLPKWWNDGISAQLSAGVRVWHILPTVSAYSDNT